MSRSHFSPRKHRTHERSRSYSLSSEKRLNFVVTDNMFKRLIHKALPEVAVPAGTLKAAALEPRLVAHHGIPGTASILAYDPTQRLLAIGTRDGRIKVFGQEGVEVCFVSKEQAPCKYLEFMENKGCIVQATTRRHLEVWSLEDHECVASLQWNLDITAFAVAQGTPFMYLGDERGHLNVLQFEDGMLTVMPYWIPPDVTMAGLVRPGSDTAPALVGILPQPGAEHSRVVLAYDNGILVLWDLHDLRVLATRGGTELQRARLAEAGDRLADLRHGKAGLEKPSEPLDEEDEDDREICSLCWACSMGSTVAAGYTDGDVALWAFPSPGQTMSATAGGALAEFSGVPLREIQLVPKGMKVPVTLLKWCSAGTAKIKGGGRLYMFGGGSVGLPEVVSIVSLASEWSGKPPRSLPWFGPVADMLMVPAAESALKATALMVLTVPGQLHVWDEVRIGELLDPKEADKPLQPLPEPVALEFHLGESAVTASKMLLLQEHLFFNRLFSKLPAQSKRRIPSALPSGVKWPISGGAPAVGPGQREEQDAPPCIYFTGHHSGLVHLWDASTPELIQLCTAPAQVDKDRGEADGVILHPVSALEFCSTSGLLVVAHEHGVVRLHLLSEEPRAIWRRNMERDESIHVELVEARAGFQCIAVLALHRAAVKSIAIASGPGRLALGDDSGVVSIFCLRHFRLIYHGPCMPGVHSGITSLAFAMLPFQTGMPLPSHSQKGKGAPSPKNPVPIPAVPELVIYAAAANSSLGVLEAASGQLVGVGPLSTKHSSRAVGLYLLDQSGQTLLPFAGPLSFRWALEEPRQAAERAMSSEDDESFSLQNPGSSLAATSLSTSLGASSELRTSSDCSDSATEDSGREPRKAEGSSRLDCPQLDAPEEGEETATLAQGGAGSGSKQETAEVKQQQNGGQVAEERDGSQEMEIAVISKDSWPLEVAELRAFSRMESPGDPEVEVAESSSPAEPPATPGEPRAAVGSQERPLEAPKASLGPEGSAEAGPGSQGQRSAVSLASKELEDDSSPEVEYDLPFAAGDLQVQRIKSLPKGFSVNSLSSPTNSLPPTPHSALRQAHPTPSTSQAPSPRGPHPAPAHRHPSLPPGLPPPPSENPRSETAYVKGREWPEPVFVLLVSDDYLRLYSTTVILQAERVALKKVKAFEGKHCIWASTFGLKDHYPFGLMLLSNKGDVEVKSLPDLVTVTGGTLSEYVTWKYEPSSTMEQTACAADGRLAVLATETELARVSLFASETSLGLATSRPTLHDAELASAAMAAVAAASPSPASGGPKHAITKMWGGVKSAMAIASGVVGSPRATPSGGDLRSLFASCPYGGGAPAHEEEAVPENAEELARRKATALLGLDETDWAAMGGPPKLEPIVIEGPLEEAEEEDELRPQPQHQVEPKKDKLGGLFGMMKDKHQRKKDEERQKKDKEKEKDARSQLLSGGSDTPPEAGPPRQRTAAEIKAAYGFKGKTNDAANAAANARDKLHERGQKIEELANQTDELEANAADFAKLAEELLKKEQNRKWWELG